jgi:hypothetical protein
MKDISAVLNIKLLSLYSSKITENVYNVPQK